MEVKNLSVQQVVVDHFGEELGNWLYDNNYIIPVGNDKQPYKIKSWKEFKSFNFKYIRDLPPGLAVVMNPRLNILDVDDKSLVLGKPNVITNKGAHYWFTPDDSTPKTTVSRKAYDLKTTGYVVFYGEGKTLVHDYIDTYYNISFFIDTYYSSIKDRVAPLPACSESINSETPCEKSAGQSAEGYTSLVEASNLGSFRLRVDSEKVTKQYLSQMKGMPEGGRNQRLFRIAIEFHRLNLNLRQLKEAAIESGLTLNEIENTIASAGASFDIDPGYSVMERVFIWHQEASRMMRTEQQQTILDYIGFRAIEDNSLAPMVNQTKLSEISGINRAAISKTFTRGFCSRWGLLRAIKQPGLQPNGTSWPNNYVLCMSNKPIHEDTVLVDEAINLGRV